MPDTTRWKYPKHVDVWLSAELLAQLDRKAKEVDRPRAWVMRWLLMKGLRDIELEQVGWTGP